jgi:hypothetical protein
LFLQEQIKDIIIIPTIMVTDNVAGASAVQALKHLPLPIQSKRPGAGYTNLNFNTLQNPRQGLYSVCDALFLLIKAGVYAFMTSLEHHPVCDQGQVSL